MMKKIINGFLLTTALLLGFSNNANAQVLDWINKAAETVSKATDTYNNARNTYNNARDTYNQAHEDKSEYKVVTSVNMFYVSTFNGSGTTTGSTSAQIIQDGYGNQRVKKGSSVYYINENGSYDPYSSDFNYKYKYWVSMDGKIYRFNM
jgi:hypothetical protein